MAGLTGRHAAAECQIFVLICLPQRRNCSSAEAARPSVFIVYVHRHAQFLRCIHTQLEASKPFLLHIGDFQPSTRMHKKTGHPLGGQLPELPHQFIMLHIAVKAVKHQKLCIAALPLFHMYTSYLKRFKWCL